MPNDCKFNALKTGAYAFEPLLPWENPEERERLRVDMLNDLRPLSEYTRMIAEQIVETAWLQTRQHKTTAIATHRHTFGRALEEAGAKTWQEALSIARATNIEVVKTLQGIVDSESEIAKTLLDWDESEGRDLKKFARKALAILKKNYKRIVKIEGKLDAERDFFLEYSPKHLERRIRIENSLSARLRSLHADFQVAQEAAHIRAKLCKSGESGESSDDSLEPRDKSPRPRGNGGPSAVNEPERTSDNSNIGLDTENLDQQEDGTDD